MSEQRLVAAAPVSEDAEGTGPDPTLRPQLLDEFIGQQQVRRNLKDDPQ